MRRVCAIAVIASLFCPAALTGQIDLTPPAAKKRAANPIGNEMMLRSAKLRSCLDRQAAAIAPKPVDLETATVAVMARCAAELNQMRQFLTAGIPNFSPGPDYWEKEIEPVYTKEARKAVALARTRDVPEAPRPVSPAPPRPNEKNQI